MSVVGQTSLACVLCGQTRIWLPRFPCSFLLPTILLVGRDPGMGGGQSSIEHWPEVPRLCWGELLLLQRSGWKRFFGQHSLERARVCPVDCSGETCRELLAGELTGIR